MGDAKSRKCHSINAHAQYAGFLVSHVKHCMFICTTAIRINDGDGGLMRKRKTDAEKMAGLLSVGKLDVILENGSKGIGDIRIRVTAHNAAITFAEWLFIGEQIMLAEDAIYPKPRWLGRTMLLNAFKELHDGVPLDTVLKHYRLKRNPDFKIIDKRGSSPA